jgi:hypothetical protein
LFPDFPWFLDDLRPQGFLGRAFARQYAKALLCPEDPRLWRADQTLHALLAFGSDLPGNLVIGERALQAAMTLQGSTVLDLHDLPELAQNALAGAAIGSSAAGEQPKLALNLRDTDGLVRPSIVKFSPDLNTAIGQRVADLLETEVIADALLSTHPRSRTIDVGSRRFLIMDRFDRTHLPNGAIGRMGMLSLGSVDTAYFGGLDNWLACAQRLEKAGWLSPVDAQTLMLRYEFGRLIGNTDMHFGNVSLHFDIKLPFSLAPNYDMLPMHFMPRAMEVFDTPFQPPQQGHGRIFEQARDLALQFWHRVVQSSRISKLFRDLAEAYARP